MTRNELVDEIIGTYTSIISIDGAFPPKPRDYIAPLRLMLKKDLIKLSEITGTNPDVIYSMLRAEVPADDIRKDIEALWKEKN